jgi:hypothetical protein
MNYFKLLSLVFAILFLLFLGFYKYKKIDLQSLIPKKNSGWLFLNFWIFTIVFVYTWLLALINTLKYTYIFAFFITFCFIKAFMQLLFYDKYEKIINTQFIQIIMTKNLFTIKNIDYKLIDFVYLFFIILFFLLGIFVY